MPKKRRGERSDGLIQVEVSLGYGPDGKRKKKSFYGKTRKEANEKADAFRATLASGIDLARQETTVEQWTKEWIATYKKGVSHSTQNGYRSALAVHVLPKIGHMRVADVRHKDLQQVLNSCEGMSETMIGNICTVLTQPFKQAARNRLIEHNPAVDLERPKGTRGTHRLLQDWEINTIKDNWRVYHVGIWAMLMLYAGLRRGEMAALRWEDIDFIENIIHVRHGVYFVNNRPIIGNTKTPAGIRDIPIIKPLMDALYEIKADSQHEHVCLSSSGNIITEAALVSNWKTWLHIMELAANGQEPKLEQGRRKKKPDDRVVFSIQTHDLRHTFATTLYDAGVDEKTAQYLLGHESGEMTRELYTHLSERTKTASISAWMDHTRPSLPTALPTLPTIKDVDNSTEQEASAD